MIPENRPYVILNAAMSVDARISSRIGDCEFSDESDWKRVHQLRARVDAIMVGRGTIEADDSKLTIKSFSNLEIPITKYPTRVVVDSLAKTSPSSRVFTVEHEKYPTILAVTQRSPRERLNQIKSIGVTVIECGAGPHVDLIHLMRELRNRNIKLLLLEGGGTLNFSMVQNKLIDEISLSIKPVLVGGTSSVSLIGGEGFEKIKDACQLELISAEKLGQNLLVRYIVRY